MEKIAGALAEAGAPLAEVARVAREVNDRSRSFGVALSACTTPAAGKPTFELSEAEVELGIGIHGEPGRTRDTMRDARELTGVAIDAIHEDMPLSGDVLVMVNGMGGTPLIELYVAYAEVAGHLADRGARAARSLVGNYVTSLDMQGFSVTVCRLTDELTRLWDAPSRPRPCAGAAEMGAEVGAEVLTPAFFGAWIEEAARSVRAERDELTRLDAAIGDADHGTNLDRGFTEAVRALGERCPATPGAVLVLVGSTLIRKVGGASGPLYGTAFREAGKALGDAPAVSAADLAAALTAGVAGVRRLGSAAEGDKTMVDALAPAAGALAEAVREGRGLDDALGAASAAAAAGAAATIPMPARKGRASYLGPRSVGHQDPGATSAALILRALHTVAARW
nr:hypothetical protein GCM10020093_000480 [Planobispora longispora]